MSKEYHEDEIGFRALINRATLTRIKKDDNCTLGVMSVTKQNGYSWACKTLELPDKGNKNGISCIPEGEYDVEYTKSPSFSRLATMKARKKDPKAPEVEVFTYELKDVPGRAGIRIHSANYTRQLRGCIALGSMHKDLDGDGTTDVVHSGKTMEEFEKLMDKKPFKLKI